MICLKSLLRIYGKKSNPKKLKNKKFFGCLSCLRNKRFVVLIHNSTTIYAIDMRLFVP
jgi:hypothetical protein